MAETLFASDKFNVGKILEIALLVISLLILIFYSTNIPELMAKAQLYWWLLMTGIVLVGVSFVVPKIDTWTFDMPVWDESPVIPSAYNPFLLVGFIAIGLITFLFISQTGYTIAGTTFQILELGVWGEAFLSIFCAIAEDVVFFSAVPALIFLFGYGLTKNFPFSVFLILLITPITFLAYHTLHYGFENIVASTTVYIFGLELTGAIVLFRKLLYCHIRHGINNLSLILLRQMSLTTIIVLSLGSWWFWIGVVILIVIGVFKLMRRR